MTWSNRLSPDWSPTSDAVGEMIQRVEREAWLFTYGRLPSEKGPAVPPEPLPPWCYDVAQKMGWIDATGNVTALYWQRRAEMKR